MKVWNVLARLGQRDVAIAQTASPSRSSASRNASARHAASRAGLRTPLDAHTLNSVPSKVVLTGDRELLVKPEPMVLAEVLARGEWATFEQLTGTLTVIPPHAVLYVEQVPPESGG